MYDKSQLMRGIMEGCILSIIGRERTYGYGIVEQLRENGFSEVKEGTIYPLLLRLEKRGMIEAEFFHHLWVQPENITVLRLKERSFFTSFALAGIRWQMRWKE